MYVSSQNDSSIGLSVRPTSRRLVEFLWLQSIRRFGTQNDAITNHTVVITGTTPASAQNMIIPYPTGFNSVNSTIVSTQISVNGIWRNETYMAGDQSYVCYSYTGDTGVVVYPAGSAATSKPVIFPVSAAS